MTPHQTLNAVKGGLDISMIEITRALYETGDLVDKTDKYWLQREITKLLEKNKEGMTSYAISKIFGVNPDAARTSMKRNKRVYIHSWIVGKSNRQTAVYKCVKEGLLTPKNAIMTTGSQDRDERLKQLGYEVKGLTVWQTVRPWGLQ